MAWNDAPPTPEELAPAPAGKWDAEPPKPEELEPPKTLEGFAGNVGKGLLNAVNPLKIGMGLAQNVKTVAYDLPKNIIENTKALGSGAAKAISGEGEWSDIPGTLKKGPIAQQTEDYAHTVAQDPAGYLYNQPVEAAMLAATPLMGTGALGKIAGKVLPESTLPYLEKFARSQKIKDLEASGAQIRQVGPERAGQIADYAFEKKIGGPLTGSIGKQKAITALDKQVGGEIGSIRKAAGDAGVTHSVPDLVAQIKARLDPIINTGARSDEIGAYQNAIVELEKLGKSATPEQIAQKAHYLNEQASNPKNLNKPIGAMSDVANQLSRINDEAISKAVGPERAARYTQLRDEYGKIQPMKAFEKRGDIREMTSRGGPAGMGMAAIRKMMDVAGHKALASGAHQVVKAAKSPALAGIEQRAAPVVGGLAASQTANPEYGNALTDYLKRMFGQ